MRRRIRTLLLATTEAALLASVTLAGGAHAAVGIESASRHAGAPGSSVTLTLGCGFCFPPCVGPKGQRHPKGFEHGPCMLGTKEDPPAWFGISLLPRDRALALADCGEQGICPPREPLGPPRRAPYTYLGRAVPPPGGNDPGSGDPPRYRVGFTVPDLRPGAYAYAIWCDACAHGRKGALISVASSPLWRLTIR
ncbi:MAG: hypothetical protein JST08_10825 [Actinobacteria bacterium]|nr:hypothetical protein [Actinomycetota bacterium]